MRLVSESTCQRNLSQRLPDFILDGEPSRISPCAALHFVGRQWPAASHLKRSQLMAMGEI
jgi:hypothetical protein